MNKIIQVLRTISAKAHVHAISALRYSKAANQSIVSVPGSQRVHALNEKLLIKSWCNLVGMYYGVIKSDYRL